jgi:hypothetical protein
MPTTSQRRRGRELRQEGLADRLAMLRSVTRKAKPSYRKWLCVVFMVRLSAICSTHFTRSSLKSSVSYRVENRGPRSVSIRMPPPMP